MTAIIAFEQVSKRYRLRHERARSFREAALRLVRRPIRPTQRDELWALREVSFAIERGESVGLVGANGAGKSTILKLISRVIVPSAGRVAVRGRVAALLELGTGFHPDLSGRDNVFLSGALAGMDQAEMQRKYDSIVAFAELADFMDVPVKHYSSGMFARLAFAVSIHLEPEALLVDEVLAVGDQHFQRKCLDRIGELRQAGMTIFLVSHALENVRELCARSLWFDHGRLLADGATDGVVRQYLNRVFDEEQQRLAAAGVDDSPATRWGSRAIRVDGVRFLDGQGDPRQVFATGEPFVVELDYAASQPVPAPVFGLAFWRNDGVHVSGPNTDFSGLTLPTVQGSGRVRFTIPALPLLEGLYHVSVAAVSTDHAETYDFHDRMYSFRVSNHAGGSRERYGLLTFNGQWAHTVSGPVP
jgi:lipopolysaccharide transport system ATP-binding protein